MIEYQATRPPTEAEPSPRDNIDPTENVTPGQAARATETIRGDRSIPETDNPNDPRYPVIRPGPHPTSTTGPDTSEANHPNTARSPGLDSSAEASTAA